MYGKVSVKNLLNIINKIMVNEILVLLNLKCYILLINKNYKIININFSQLVSILLTSFDTSKNKIILLNKD